MKLKQEAGQVIENSEEISGKTINSNWRLIEKFSPYALAVIAIAAVTAYFYFQDQIIALKNPQKLAQEETKRLLENVSKLIVLPAGETPTIATVSDPEKLQDQPFFSKAQKNDKVLIYTKAGKAILYSASINKILEVSPINIGNPSSPKASSTPTTNSR